MFKQLSSLHNRQSNTALNQLNDVMEQVELATMASKVILLRIYDFFDL